MVQKGVLFLFLGLFAAVVNGCGSDQDTQTPPPNNGFPPFPGQQSADGSMPIEHNIGTCESMGKLASLNRNLESTTRAIRNLNQNGTGLRDGALANSRANRLVLCASMTAAGCGLPRLGMNDACQEFEGLLDTVARHRCEYLRDAVVRNYSARDLYSAHLLMAEETNEGLIHMNPSGRFRPSGVSSEPRSVGTTRSLQKAYAVQAALAHENLREICGQLSGVGCGSTPLCDQ